jgi:predicted Zn finger-like uncharacterized protein
MKSVTTCPSCQTQFLVSDEQLSQYNGKVRCGHCLSVFNAIDHMVVDVQPVTASHQEDVQHHQTEDVISQPEVAETTPLSNQTHMDATPPESVINTFDDHPAVDTAAENKLSDDDALVQHFTEAPQETVAPVINTDANDDKPVDAQPSKRADLLKELFEQANLPLEEVSATLPDREEIKIEPELGDLAQAEMDAQYQEDIAKVNEFEQKPEYQYYLEERKTTSTALLALAGALVLAVILQCVFFYRHTIAMEFPQTKPYFVSICQTLGCKIDLPKEIHLFSIDDSTIEEDASHQGVIRLSSTITNRAEFNQAFPNLEVTLTDTQDHPKLRRIFKPSEYLTKEFNLEVGIAAGDSISINMPLMADDLKPAGFRLLVSY